MEKQEKIKVLYLDDEPNNLICFMASFRFDYKIFIAPTIEKAYEYLKANPDISIILADQKMPNKTGVAFFEEVKFEFPKPVRILITGYSDIEAVIDAVNKGHIYRYIKKPWEDDEIRLAIDESHKFYLTNSLLSSKNIELQAAYDELGKFAYSVSHDLRGPLASMLGAIDISQNMDNIADIREIMGMMDGSIKKLDSFIRSIHEYYSLKKGKIVFENIDFKDVSIDMDAIYRLACKNENIQFNINVVQNEPFYSDIICINIILNNLLSNAIKYQKKNAGQKYINLNIEVVDNKVIIFVKDNGIGIYESHIKNIFEMFYRATSEESGSGFGLFNVKDALYKIKGEIEVDSVFNEGTTFKVIIPGNSNGK